MSRFLSITEARKQLLELPAGLEDEPIIVTRRGKPVMVALSYEQYEAMSETLEILADPELAAGLRESIAQADRGETVGLDEVRARLGH